MAGIAKVRNERSSARIARIAGKVMAVHTRLGVLVTDGGVQITWPEIRALAASVLTQTADRAVK